MPPASKKPKSKKKRKKNKNKTCGYEASPEPEKSDDKNETFYDQYLVQVVRTRPDNDDIVQHRRRRVSSRGDKEDESPKVSVFIIAIELLRYVIFSRVILLSFFPRER